MTMSELVAHLMSVEWPIAHVCSLSNQQLVALWHISEMDFKSEQWAQWRVVKHAVALESRHRFEQMVQEGY